MINKLVIFITSAHCSWWQKAATSLVYQCSQLLRQLSVKPMKVIELVFTPTSFDYRQWSRYDARLHWTFLVQTISFSSADYKLYCENRGLVSVRWTAKTFFIARPFVSETHCPAKISGLTNFPAFNKFILSFLKIQKSTTTIYIWCIPQCHNYSFEYFFLTTFCTYRS